MADSSAASTVTRDEHTLRVTLPVKDSEAAEAAALKAGTDYFGETLFRYDVSTSAIVTNLGLVLGYQADITAWAATAGGTQNG